MIPTTDDRYSHGFYLADVYVDCESFIDWNHMFKLSYLLLGYFMFLFIGALIFYELNALEERKRHIEINKQIRQFINRNEKCLKGKNF